MSNIAAARTTESANDNPAADDYGAWYYRHYNGPAYDPSEPHWHTFFSGIAERIEQILRPQTVLDAGCAMGILVGSLRARGMDAEGIDVSEYAIEHGDPRAAGHLRVGDLSVPLDRRYDLITCIEVLEHIDAGSVEAAVANLCAATDLFLLSTTPDDFNEGTHVNVKPPSYWLSLFADHGFVRRFDVDASFVSPWAVVLERRHVPHRRLVSEYETVLWNLRRENHGTRAAVIDRDRRLAQAEERETVSRAEIEAATQRLVELDDLREAVVQQRSRAEIAERELAAARSRIAATAARLKEIEGSTSYRTAIAVARRLRWARPLTRRLLSR